MPTLRISCFGILLKHYLLRHHADEVAPKGKFHPEIERALSAVPADFQVQADIPERNEGATMAEEYLQVHLSLRQADEPFGGLLVLAVQGILSRSRRDHGAHTLMPGRLNLAATNGLKLGATQIQQALSLLEQPELSAVVESESRIGIFRVIHQARASQVIRQPRTAVKLARVA